MSTWRSVFATLVMPRSVFQRVLQECLPQCLKKCPRGESCREVSQESLPYNSYYSVLQKCLSKMPRKRVLQECPIRASQECAPQEPPTKSGLQACRSIFRRFPTSGCQGVPQEQVQHLLRGSSFALARLYFAFWLRLRALVLLFASCLEVCACLPVLCGSGPFAVRNWAYSYVSAFGMVGLYRSYHFVSVSSPWIKS